LVFRQIVYLLYLVIGEGKTIPVLSIVLLAAIYGLQALIFIFRLRWDMIAWMICEFTPMREVAVIDPLLLQSILRPFRCSRSSCLSIRSGRWTTLGRQLSLPSRWLAIAHSGSFSVGVLLVFSQVKRARLSWSMCVAPYSMSGAFINEPSGYRMKANSIPSRSPRRRGEITSTSRLGSTL
jgi:hypothetical protein